ESKLSKLTNRAGLWVDISIANSVEGDGFAAECHVVAVARRPARVPTFDRQQQLAAAYAELSNDGTILTPLTSPISAAVGVVVGDGNGKQGEPKFSVQVTLKCSLATFVPWSIQLGSSAPAMATPCLALRLPDETPGCAPWVISGLELTGAAGENSRMITTRLIAVNSTLVVIPLANRLHSDTTLNEEVFVDTVQCVLATSIDRDQLLPPQGLASSQAAHGLVLPLPSLLFGASDVAGV
ncbi:hypothetical protein GGI20_006410, partial [Coemansia sp. BCRC 34301]